MLGRLTAVTALVLAAGLIAAGCGDDDDEPTTAATTTTTEAGATGATGAVSGEPLSHEEFVTQADAICKAGDKEIDSEAQQIFSGGEPSEAEQEQFVTETVIPNVQEQVDGIAALTPPGGEEEEVQAIVDAANDALAEIEQDPAAFVSGSNPFAEANRLARDYGLEVCGSS
jgi:hypothetical protein